MATLNSDQIRLVLPAAVRERLETIETFAELDSTNDYLLSQSAPLPQRMRVAIAGHQTAGRGRMDKRWVSPPNAGIWMSLAYTFERMPDQFNALTLAQGVAAIAALEELGFSGVLLKWPNDLIAENRKLGGLLAEMRTGKGDGVTIVLGIGINVDFGQASDTSAELTPPETAIDLRSLSSQMPDRQELIVALIAKLFDCFDHFGSSGFAGFRNAWQRQDWLRGRRIRIDNPDGAITGTASGIDASGALLLTSADGMKSIISGSVTVLPGEQRGP